MKTTPLLLFAFTLFLFALFITPSEQTKQDTYFHKDKAKLWAEAARKYKFCTKVCGRLKGPVLSPLKGTCMNRCRYVRQQAIVRGHKIIVCKRLCGHFQNSSFYPICHKACNSIKKQIPFKK